MSFRAPSCMIYIYIHIYICSACSVHLDAETEFGRKGPKHPKRRAEIQIYMYKYIYIYIYLFFMGSYGLMNPYGGIPLSLFDDVLGCLWIPLDTFGCLWAYFSLCFLSVVCLFPCGSVDFFVWLSVCVFVS